MDDYKSESTVRMKYLKYWLIAFVIITAMYLFIEFCSNPVTIEFSDVDRSLLSRLIPIRESVLTNSMSPLSNFTEPMNVFGMRD